MDLIDRQAAIEKYGDWYVEEGTEEGFISDMRHFLEMLPSAEPERKKGKWIPTKYEDVYTCSKCEIQIGIIGPIFRYCPNCGARMDEE